MRSLITIAKKLVASMVKIRHLNFALFALVLLLSGMAIGRTSAPRFVREVWAAAIGGIGTVGKVAAFSASDTIGDSQIFDDGTNVGIGTTNPRAKLQVAGNVLLDGSISGPFSRNASVMQLGRAGRSSPDAGYFVFGDGTGWKMHFAKASDDGATKFMTIDDRGNVSILGTLDAETATARVKNFVIDHPLKDGYQLIHSSLEGPEIGVFYRGSGRLVGGRATITLPDYFDALTRDHTATVLLTAKGEMPFLLSYDRFDEKSFMVHGAKADGAFDWEVKATRQDVPPLEVERKK